jgi:hypothetical protein
MIFDHRFEVAANGCIVHLCNAGQELSEVRIGQNVGSSSAAVADLASQSVVTDPSRSRDLHRQGDLARIA